MDRASWIQWRKNGLGSSDVPILHGFHEYRTPRELWLSKQPETEVKDEPANFVQAKGNSLEPIARMRFAEILSGMHFQDVNLEPKNFEMDDLNFMRASLDAYAVVGGKKIGAEVKYMGAKKHEDAGDKTKSLMDRIPFQYWVQMQHQILVAQLDEHWFVSIQTPGDPLHYVRVLPDPDFIKTHIQICSEFWKQVISKKEPEISDSDMKILKTKGAKTKAKRYANLHARAKVLETEMKEIADELKKLVDHPHMICGPLKFTEASRQGSIDLKTIPQLQGIDLEPYRKPATTYVSITVSSPQSTH